MDELAKNLWLLLTLVVPGMTTYGTLRLLLLLYDCNMDRGAFEKMDDSVLVSSCLIVAIALVQQSVAITLEAAMSFLCTKCRSIDRKYVLFFCDRFRLAASGRLNENATRIFGNVFTSVNVTIGQMMILLYFFYRGLGFQSPAIRVVLGLVAANLISSWFRLRNAASIIGALEEVTEETAKQAAA